MTRSTRGNEPVPRPADGCTRSLIRDGIAFRGLVLIRNLSMSTSLPPSDSTRTRTEHQWLERGTSSMQSHGVGSGELMTSMTGRHTTHRGMSLGCAVRFEVVETQILQVAGYGVESPGSVRMDAMYGDVQRQPEAGQHQSPQIDFHSPAQLPSGPHLHVRVWCSVSWPLCRPKSVRVRSRGSALGLGHSNPALRRRMLGVLAPSVFAAATPT